MTNTKLDSFRDFQWNDNGGIQLAIAAYLREKIESGALPAGMQLPSLRKLAELWGTSFFSVKLATDALQGAGLLTKHQGHGKTVRGRASLQSMPSKPRSWVIFRSLPTRAPRESPARKSDSPGRPVPGLSVRGISQ